MKKRICVQPNQNAALLSVQDIADFLDVSTRTVWRMARDGRLPRPLHVTGQIRRWRRCEVMKALGDGGVTFIL